MADKQEVSVLDEDDYWQRPDFIYGGPFIKVSKPSIFIDTATPINLPLQGTFKKSFAYFSLKERLPIILTKIIDRCSRENKAIQNECGARETDVQNFIGYITKLKNELLTNKNYERFTVDTAEAKKWNEYVDNVDIPNYFTNSWLFTECYVYRRVREGCELNNMGSFDPFAAQKREQVTNAVEPMCLVADKLAEMIQEESPRDKRKVDFILLAKLCLWSNKCDLSLSAGAPVDFEGKANSDSEGSVDPWKLITDLKDKLTIDDSGKAFEIIEKKKEAMLKNIEKDAPGAPDVPYVPEGKGKKAKGKPKEPEKPKEEEPKEGDPPKEEEQKVPCTQKITVPKFVFFDIICDNAGYELFTDICMAHYLIAQNMAQKVRFHLKKIPWFVSDASPNDFRYLINSCRSVNFKKSAEIAPGSPEGEEPRIVQATTLNTLADQWSQFVEDGTFVILADDFWTSPIPYKDMKKENYWLYRTLQMGITCMFKGDLNYRKLLADRNCNPYASFESCLQGFIPTPVMAIRTVKSEVICGLPKGKYDVLCKADEKWMETGDYGLISCCTKAEPLKPADRPCPFYGDECRGIVCPPPTESFNLGPTEPV